ncbi:hypothetical protein [Streptomyces katrae]|uniref:hypothetical protein n=1 Tax=Streptomyces katrae TaxID=68223 RepID=UPI0004C0CCC1|nr:hypothetical protein [Streptomyces katrae]
MTAVTAAATKARSLLAFIGVLSILGLDWTTTTRLIVGVALVAAVVMEIGGDGHRIWAALARSAPPTSI